MKEFNKLGSIEEYDCFKGIEFAPEVKKLMELFIEAWQECKSTPNCAECKYWHKREKGSLLACLSERYAEKVIAGGYAPVVHAHWQPYEDTVQCSACGFGTFMDGYFFVHGECTHANDRSFRFSFCPNCGAKMDEPVGNSDRLEDDK